MDAKFHSAIDAIKSGDASRLKDLLRQDPSLATSRSTTGHPTLLQCLVLDGKDSRNSIEMARILIVAGADLNGPLGACASCDNVEEAALLLDRGAAVNGTGAWINAIPGGFDYSGTALHYAALNGHQAMAEFLVGHGADARIKDTRVDGTPAGWAEYGGHPEVKAYLGVNQH